MSSVSGLQGVAPAGPRITLGGDECLLGERESRTRCPGSLCGVVPRTRSTGGDWRRLLYTRNGVAEADNPPWLSRALSFNAAATTSAADDSAGRFDGLLGCGFFGAGYSFRNEGHDGDGDAVEGPAELEDRLICRLSFSM